jgi:hypothetical protein
MEKSYMNYLTLEKVGGASLILGSLLLAAYSALFPVLLPLGNSSYDYVMVVLNPNWVRLAVMAFAGVLLMLIGFYAVYSRIRSTAGMVGAIGFLFIEAAYLLQACKVTWELFLYPVIAKYPMSAFLLRDAIFKHDPSVWIFRIMASITILLGIVLFCYTLYRSGEYPKSAAALIFAGALVYALGPMISIFVSVAGIFTLAVGCLLIGIRLFQVKQA